jgi:hypothetical protein
MAISRSTFAAKPDGTPTPIDPMVPDWSFFVKKIVQGPGQQNTLVIHGVAVNLDPTLIDPTANLAIYAEHIAITGSIVLSGRDVILHARQISGTADAKIDVSGAAGSGWQPGYRQDGPSLGAAGLNGDSGPAGSPGGKIAIYGESISGNLVLVSNGGAGGRGRDGGNGAQGEIGAPGAYRDYCNNQGAGTPGGQGGRGGDAGMGGTGGCGGDGGVITLQLLTEIPPKAVSCLVEPGLAGPNGLSGSPGPGGYGGPGGLGWRMSHGGSGGGRGGQGQDEECVEQPRGPQGAPGPPGSGVGPNVQNGGDGKTGLGSVEISTAAKLASTACLPPLLLISHWINVLYLSAQYEACVSPLNWLEVLTKEAPPPSTNAEEWSALHGVVTCQMSQMAAGLDFYGLPRTYVPMVTFDSFDAPIKEMIDNAKRIEVLYRSYYEINIDKPKQETALKGLLTEAHNSIESLEKDLTALGNESNEIENTLARLLDSLESQQLSLLAAADAFRKAVEAKTARCNFIDVIMCVASIVTVVGEAYADVVAIVAAAKALKDAANIKDAIKEITLAGGDIKDIAAKYSTVKDDIKTLASSSKIAILQEHMDALLKEYAALPEAQQYKAQIDTFCDTCQTRNQKALEFTGIIVRRQGLIEQKAGKTQEVARLDALLADTKDPTLLPYVGFLAKLLSDSKQRLIRALYEEHRAFEYWSLTYVKFSLDSYDMVVLGNQHDRIRADALQARIDRNRAPQKFGPEHPLRVSISEKEYPAEFKNFKAHHILTFSIGCDHPAFRLGFSAISLQQVIVKVIGIVTDNGTVSIQLIHHGRSQFMTPSRKRVIFSHKARVTQIVYNVKTGPITDDKDNLGQDGTFAGLSPFATWTLAIKPADNVNPKFDGVTEIQMDFSGLFFPFTAFIEPR